MVGFLYCMYILYHDNDYSVDIEKEGKMKESVRKTGPKIYEKSFQQ